LAISSHIFILSVIGASFGLHCTLAVAANFLFFVSDRRQFWASLYFGRSSHIIHLVIAAVSGHHFTHSFV